MADKQSHEGGEPPPETKGASPKDVQELQGHFDEQQHLIGQLREAIKNQDTAKSQGAGMDDYAARLAKMKPRLMRGRASGSKRRDPKTQAHSTNTNPEPAITVPHITASAESAPPQVGQHIAASEPIPVNLPTIPTQGPSDTNPVPATTDCPTPSIEAEKSETDTSRDKILLLRRRLEENRIKFERQQRDNTNKRAAMEDMKDRIDKLRVEVEERDHVIESLQDSGSVDPNIQHLYQQILYKDNTIIELTDSVNQLEILIKDQTEQLSEKDQIIAARTEAVGLVTIDKDEKLFSAINEADMLKDTIKDLHRTFAAKEETWSTVEQSMNSVIQEKTKKVNILEENCQRVESVRFELSTTNAEIQEKLVKVQIQCQELTKAVNSANNEVTLKSNEISELKKKLSRAEAFGQKKLKVFEKHFKGLDQDDLGEQIAKLSNDIAVLEEEKGNLQLKLVDFDDFKDNDNKMTEKNRKLQAEIQSMSGEIQSHLVFITSLENEKISLVQDINQKNLMFNDLDAQLAKDKVQIEELKQNKITSELRLCALEEERDLAAEKCQTLESTLGQHHGPSMEDISLQKHTLEQEIDQLKLTIEQLNEQCTQYKQEMSNQQELDEQKLEEKQCLISLLAEKESIITTQAIDSDNHELVLQNIQAEIASKVSIIQECQHKINGIHKEKENLTIQFNESQQSVEQYKIKADQLTTQLQTSANNISELKNTIKRLEEAVLEKNKAFQKLEYKLEGALHEIQIKDQNIQGHCKKLDAFQNILDERSSQIESLENKYVDKCTMESKLEKDCENIRKSLEGNLSTMEAELNMMSNMIKDKDDKIETLMNELDTKDVELANNQEMIGNFEQDNCTKNQTVDELTVTNKELQSSVLELKHQILDLEKIISCKTQELFDAQSIIDAKTECLQKLETEMQSKTAQIEGLQTSLEQFHIQQQETTQELLNTKSSSMEICELLQKEIDNKTNELISVQSILQQDSSTRDARLVDLQVELTNRTEEITALQYELAQSNGKIDKFTQTIANKESQITDAGILLQSKELQIAELITQSDLRETEFQVSRSEGQSTEIQQFQDQLCHTQTLLIDLQHTYADLEKEKTGLDKQNQDLLTEIRTLKQDVESLREQYSCTIQQQEITEECVQKNASSFFSSFTESDGGLQKKLDDLSAEKCTLQNELEVARQAITRLETSLATHSTSVDETPESDWGVIDLGQPIFKDPSASIQATLIEKDKALTVIQEQLGEALEQVNNVVDAKKIVEQQMKTLEAELQHKADQICTHQQTIELLTSSVSKEPEISEVVDTSTGPSWSNVSENPEASPECEQPSSSTDNTLSPEAVAEIQYKLSWYEDQWTQWTTTYNQLSESFQTTQQENIDLKQQIQTQETQDEHRQKLTDTQQELAKLQNIETLLYEIQSENQTLQHQIAVLESSLHEATTKNSKLKDLEMLQTEMQSIVQESEAKTEGSKSRVQELELMVESAESEISRLRTDLCSLTTAGKALETERSCFEEEATNLKEELRKNNTERHRLQSEYDQLQEQTAMQLSLNAQLQENATRDSAVTNQLRSEIEVLEGDIERSRVNYEILEGESSRLRHDIELWSQSHQLLEAQKESLTTELQRLTDISNGFATEKEHLHGETQRLLEVATSAESEIVRLKTHLESYGDLDTRYQELESRYSDLQGQVCQVETQAKSSDPHNLSLEEVDWSSEGKMDTEHLQGSAYMESSLEVADLKQKVIALEKERNEVSAELHASKLKNGKMIQKVKANNLKLSNLQKEMDGLKKNKAAGFSDLDLALEEEWKAQVTKATSERDEYKCKLDELEKEKYSLATQIDVLNNAQDKYINMKERQDQNIRQYSDRNKALEGHVNSLEWRISELEESLEQKDSSPGDLSPKIQDLEQQIAAIRAENIQLAEDKQKIQNLLDNVQKQYDQLKDKKDKLESSSNTYKSSYMELYAQHEQLEEKDKMCDEVLEGVQNELVSLKSSYNALYYDHESLQISTNALTRDVSRLSSDKDKLNEEIENLTRQIDLMHEEEEEEMIRGLQEECSSHRQINSHLKDDIIQLGESIREAQTETEECRKCLEQQQEIQDMLREDVTMKAGEINFLNNTVATQENELKYQKAEIASLKTHINLLQKAKVDVSTSERNRRASESMTEDTSGLDASQVSIKLRDFRCQQMALEINKLLEERDALQLKLSCALRQNQQVNPSGPSALRVKLEELRELNSGLEQRAARGTHTSPPTVPTFVSHTAPPTPSATRHTELSISREAHGTSSTLVNWILGKSTPKEVLHV